MPRQYVSFFFNLATDPSPRGSADSNGAASTGTGIGANNGVKGAASAAGQPPAAPVTNVSGIPGSGSRRPSLSNEVLNHVASSESKATVSERTKFELGNGIERHPVACVQPILG